MTSRDTVLTGVYLSFSSDLHPNGDRLVVSQLLSAVPGNAPAGGAAEPERFLVVTNWFTELRERMGGN